jgi:hypothetical protein
LLNFNFLKPLSNVAEDSQKINGPWRELMLLKVAKHGQIETQTDAALA